MSEVQENALRSGKGYIIRAQRDEPLPRLQYQVNSPNNDALMKLFHQTSEDNGIMHDNAQIFEYS